LKPLYSKIINNNNNNNQHKEELVEWLKWQSAYVTSVAPEFNPKYHQKKKKGKIK
jgi:hypothetical protein